jgi:hypothetical protein
MTRVTAGTELAAHGRSAGISGATRHHKPLLMILTVFIWRPRNRGGGERISTTQGRKHERDSSFRTPDQASGRHCRGRRRLGRQADRPDRSCQVRPGHRNRPAGTRKSPAGGAGRPGRQPVRCRGQVEGDRRRPPRGRHARRLEARPFRPLGQGSADHRRRPPRAASASRSSPASCPAPTRPPARASSSSP